MIPKLSEAIALGEFADKPGHGEWIDRREGKCGSCAVGRACLAAGYQAKLALGGRESIRDITAFMVKTWPWTVKIAPRSPITGQIVPFHSFNPVLAVMSDLYEEHKWSMQQIAAWVATIEPQDAPALPREAAAAVEEEGVKAS